MDLGLYSEYESSVSILFCNSSFYSVGLYEGLIIVELQSLKMV